ncbi:hypothetical protein MMC13_004238 [Lambiella insularis]|nr:hypothetical protein [Lambiella insularis]
MRDAVRDVSGPKTASSSAGEEEELDLRDGGRFKGGVDGGSGMGVAGLRGEVGVDGKVDDGFAALHGAGRHECLAAGEAAVELGTYPAVHTPGVVPEDESSPGLIFLERVDLASTPKPFHLRTEAGRK